jgi:hypothetical protein
VNDDFADNDTDGDGDYAAVEDVWSAGGSPGMRCDAPAAVGDGRHQVAAETLPGARDHRRLPAAGRAPVRETFPKYYGRDRSLVVIVEPEAATGGAPQLPASPQ